MSGGAGLSEVLGPTRLLGGPGSGKTETLARIAVDWLESGGDHKRVVVVTRNRIGLRVMLDHLGRLLPTCSFPPRTVTQETLARQVLRSLGEPDDQTRPLSRVGEWLAMTRAFQDATPLLDRLRPLVGDPSCIEDALEFASLLKQGLVGLALLAERLSRDQGVLAELTVIMARYQDALATMGGRDARDLTVAAVERLQRDQGALAGWADLLLVDEAEDLNPAQWQLLELLVERMAPPCRAVLAGEPTVALPSFQGPPARFFNEAFPRRFHAADLALPGPETAWLAAVGEVLAQRSPGLGSPGSEGLGPRRPATAAIWSAGDETEEAMAIAREIRRARLAEEVAYDEVAILLWDPGAQLAPIAAALAELRVPFHVWQRRWAGSIATRAVITWLRALAAPQDDLAVAEALSLGPQGLQPSELRDLRQRAARDQVRLATTLANLARAAPNSRENQGLGRTPALASLWLDLGGGRPDLGAALMDPAALRDVIGKIERGTGLSQLALSHLETAAAMANLDRVASDAIEASRRLGAADRPLSEWIEVIEVAVRVSGVEQDHGVLAPPEAVAVVSAQNAKGASWRRVFLPGMVAGAMPRLGRDGGLLTQAELQTLLDRVPELEDVMGAPGDHLERECRRFLMATTRAREQVVLSWSRRGSLAEREPSTFLAAVKTAGGVQEVAAPLATPVAVADLVCHWAIDLSHGRPPTGSSRMPEHLARARQVAGWMTPWDPVSPEAAAAEGHLSASALSAWLACPRLYYFGQLRLRREDTVATVLGVAAHSLLEFAHRERASWADSPDLFTPMALTHIHDQLMPGVRERLVDPLGSFYVEAWLNRLARRWAKVVLEERRMGEQVASEVAFDLPIEEFALVGKIDSLWHDPQGDLEVVDYKTSEGALPGGPDMRRQVLGNGDSGPSDWQLPIYAMAARDLHLDGTAVPVRARNWYLGPEPNRSGSLVTRGFRLGQAEGRLPTGEVELGQDELDRVEAEIARQARLIRQGRFAALPRHDIYTCRGYLGCSLARCCDGEGTVGGAFPLPVPRP